MVARLSGWPVTISAAQSRTQLYARGIAGNGDAPPWLPALTPRVILPGKVRCAELAVSVLPHLPPCEPLDRRRRCGVKAI